MFPNYIYPLVRAAVFILLPVYLYTRPLMPRPLQVMQLSFGLAVLGAEIAARLIQNQDWRRRIRAVPFLAGAGSIYPYLAQVSYFDTTHQLLIGLILLLGILYWASGRLVP